MIKDILFGIVSAFVISFIIILVTLETETALNTIKYILVILLSGFMVLIYMAFGTDKVELG